ncbi:uncharacterized protein LOC110300626 [Mus caroli]|uniref:Uncharacterized protein LOC110300626 n=1 Tax=Mus caroli TaxID=10089 RepID=A0A6P7R562_MUSCR|nr:uncharacterized protein LOC110300626 [Mus caroli]
MPLIEEHRESISSQPNEEMAEASEQSEAEDIKGPLEIPSESSNEGNDLLPEDESPTMEQITDIGRYKSIYITAEPIDNMSLISRTQSEMETLEAINYDNVLNEGEEQDKKFGKDSDTGRRLKRKRSSKIGKLPTHEEKSDTVHYEEATKAKVPSKKRASDAYGDEAYESRGSVSKAHIQTKKQGTHQRGRSSASDAYGDEAYESRGSVTKAHIQTKKQETHRRGKGSVQEEESDTMHYEEVTGAKVPSKKRASDAYGDETYESRGSVTKAHTHTKKQGTHQRGKGSVHEEESDTMNYEEPRKSKISSRRKGFALPITNQVEMHSSESQGSISKSNTETKKQGTHKRGRGIAASDAYGDEAYESQGSVTKAHIQTKKQGTHQRGKGSDADGALKPVNQGSDSKADTERKKHESSKGESTISKDSIPVLDEVQDKTFEHQESGLRLEVQAKKLTFGPQNIHNEESATDIKQEYQNVPSSSQVQLKKQKSLGGEIFTTHFVVPAESHAQLYQTYTPETQIERATTSGTGRLTTIPVEHPKKEASPDNLFPEKKLYITRAPTQTKKQYPPWDTNAESQNIKLRSDENYMSVDPTSKDHPQFKKLKTTHIENTAQKKTVKEVQGISEPQTKLNPTMSGIILHLDMDRVVETDLENLEETIVPHVLRSELEIGTDAKNMPETPTSREAVRTEAKGNLDVTISIAKGMKLIGKLKDQHGLSSFASKDTISPAKSLIKSSRDNQDDSLLETKPQENMSVKHHPSKIFPTKVINMLPFSEKSLGSTSAKVDVVPKPVYRTPRGRSSISKALHHLLKTSEHLKPTSTKKQNADLEKHLYISIISANKHTHKGKKHGQSNHQKLKKQDALTSTKKQKHKEQPKTETIVENDAKFDDNLRMTTSSPNIKIIKELSKTLYLDSGDIEPSDFVFKTASAAKKLENKGPSKTKNLNKESSRDIHILHLTTSAIRTLLLDEEAKIRSLEKKLMKQSTILQKSASSMKKFMFEESSKETKKKIKKRKIIVKSPHILPITTTQKLTIKEKSEISNLEKPIVRGTRILKKSTSPRKKSVLKGKSKSATLPKKCDNFPFDLIRSSSDSSKQQVEEQPKPGNVDKKVSDDSYSPNISTSPTKKHTLKGQSKSRAIYEKGVDLPNNLVLSKSASSKQEFEEQPKPGNVDKKVSDDSYSPNMSTSPTKKHTLKGQPKSENSDEKGIKRPNNLHMPASVARKRLLKALSTIP